MRDLTIEQAAQKVRSYFLGNISHDFRTSLAALNASVELLLEDLDELSREKIAQLLNSVHFGVAGLQTVIDNLLESTNIEAGQFRLQQHKTDLHQVADDISSKLLARTSRSPGLKP
jgi:two-component system, chemotaxis family, sensor kinase Cph1